MMGRKHRDQQRFKCPHCKKSFLFTAYESSLHLRDCSGMYPERKPAQEIGPKRKKKR
jgi:hypothetical protein